MVEGTFANGVALVELASLREARLIPTAIALALGMAPPTGDEALAEVGAWLADRELLLVVDNVEHLPEGFHYLGWLVSRAPRLTILVTGRRVMHLSGEHIFPVGPLDGAAATELFVQRARASYPAFAPDGSEAAIAAICRRLDGLPLAIELAAARAATLPPEALLERLPHSLTVLTSGASDLPSRQRTLRETLEWSANLLTPSQRLALARLSVFPAGCTLAGAETYAGAELGTLTTLVDDHLLLAVDVDGQRRFVMLETVREYAGTVLGDDELSAAAGLVAYCVDLLERAELKGPNQSYWLPVIDVEQDTSAPPSPWRSTRTSDSAWSGECGATGGSAAAGRGPGVDRPGPRRLGHRRWTAARQRTQRRCRTGACRPAICLRHGTSRERDWRRPGHRTIRLRRYGATPAWV